MYKLMIADDEDIVLDSIEFIVQSEFQEEIKLIRASSGIEAVERASENAPDIVFMDINMPGINGLEAIEEIKSRNSDTIFFVLSAYDEFEFARKSMRSGVKEYILKPVTKSKVIETIKKGILEVKKLRDKRINELKNREKLLKIVPVIKENFIYNLLLNPGYKKDVEEFRDILKLNIDSGFAIILDFIKNNDEDKIDFAYRIHKAHEYLRKSLQMKHEIITGALINNRIMFVIFDRKKNDEYFEISRSKSYVDEIEKHLKNQDEFDYVIGIGGYCELHEIKKSYEQALKSILVAEEKINHYYELRGDNKSDKRENLSGVEENIENNEFEEIKNKITGYIELGEIDNLEVEVLKYRIVEVLKEVLIAANKKCKIEISIKDEELKNLNEIHNTNSLKVWVRNKIDSISNVLCDNIKHNYSDSITKAVNIIESGFQEDITLEDVAAKLYISSQYLSKIFKNETGRNFTEYLLERRIEKAKELLENSRYSIKEISYRVGYNDPNYFSRVFKKEVGATPKEFRRELLF